MDLGITGRKALVNGGSAGLGKGSAKALAAVPLDYDVASGHNILLCLVSISSSVCLVATPAPPEKPPRQPFAPTTR